MGKLKAAFGNIWVLFALAIVPSFLGHQTVSAYLTTTWFVFIFTLYVAAPIVAIALSSRKDNHD